MKNVQCIKCKSNYPLSRDVASCPNHNSYYGYLDARYPYKKIRLSESKLPFEKYKKLLPLKKISIAFGNQPTPLVQLHAFAAKYGFSKLFVKDEGYNPTGSFKDRGSFVVINKAKEWGIKKIKIASSGNAALSMAAYAQKAGIVCECFVSEDISKGKKALLELYGARIYQKKGNYETIYRKVVKSKGMSWNVTPGVNFLHEEGIKYIGFEIFEQIGVPDAIVVPCGNGSLLYSVYKAFFELSQLGLISKLPRFIGVQIAGAAPLKKSFLHKKDFVVFKNTIDSQAEGIIAEESYCSPKVMQALRMTGGDILEVTDKEITKAIKEIVYLESLIPEFTSAAVYAGLKKLQPCKKSTIVAIQTANGFKNLPEIEGIFK